jgi:hypothetical protein
MVAEREVSPEKQLLRLIEESKKNSISVSKAKVSRQTKGIFSFDVWQAKFLFLKERILRSKRDISLVSEFDIKWVNRLLELLLFFLSFI